MASPLVAPPVVKPKALFCPNCGGPVERRGFGYTLTVVCPQCLSVLDASAPLLQVLQQVEAAQRRTPLIPLGTRGAFAGAPWEVIGFQTRADPEGDEWEEYLLFNPYRGFRYLTHYNGHWNFVAPLEAVPARQMQGSRPWAFYENHRYKHFSGAEAVTTFVLGEFPWRVKTGDAVRADDFIDPPLILSAEKTGNEITWSRGRYTAGAEIWKAFQLPGSAPRARGVYLNQPSPYAGKVGGIWAHFGWLLLVLFGLAIFFAAFSRQATVFHDRFRFAANDQNEPSFVTRGFELSGRPATLEVDLDTDLSNNWAYFNFALINQDTGEASDFSKEVSYYYGNDSDGSWTEGSSKASVLLPAVAPGRYYLRVEPEMASGSVAYDLTVRHDVPSFLWFLTAGVLLLIPPILYTIRSVSFERERWMASDYQPVGRGSSDD
jgi:hypothetical protein